MKLGVIGYGGRISGIVNTIKQEHPAATVVGVVDPREKEVREKIPESDRENVKFYKTLEDLVKKSKPDALLIGTRCNLHTHYGIKAAKYDIPLFLEKPVSITMQQATALEKAFKKSRCQVVVSFPLRVSPLSELTREYIAGGAIGDPIHIAALNYVPYGTVYWQELYRDYSITGGLLLQKATHDLDYMMYIMDSPIVKVSAMATYQKVFGGKKKSGLRCSECKEAKTCLESPENRVRNGTGNGKDHYCLYSVDCGSPKTGTNEDCSSVLMEFASGAQGVYTQVFFSRKDAARRGAIISGYMGTIDFDWYRNDLKRIRHHGGFSATEKASGNASHFGGDIKLIRNFIDVVKGDAKSKTPIEVGIQSVYTCLAARDAISAGKTTSVRQTNL